MTGEHDEFVMEKRGGVWVVVETKRVKDRGKAPKSRRVPPQRPAPKETGKPPQGALEKVIAVAEAQLQRVTKNVPGSRILIRAALGALRAAIMGSGVTGQGDTKWNDRRK